LRTLRSSGTGDYRRRHRCTRGHQIHTSVRGAGRHAASQERVHIAVAAVRPHEIASALWSLLAGGGRTCNGSTGYGSCNRPGVYSCPVRRGDSARNTRPRTSSEEKGLEGESNANVDDGGIGTQNSAASGAENIPQGDRDDLRRQRPQGRLRGVEGNFFLAVFPFT